MSIQPRVEIDVLLEETEWFLDAAMSGEEIARRFKLKYPTLLRYLERAKRPDLLRRCQNRKKEMPADIRRVVRMR